MTVISAAALTRRDALGLASAYLAPRSPIEAALAEIWSGAFALDRVGVHDDFFKLGGDSVKAATVAALIEQRFGQKLPLSILLRKPTIEALAAAIKAEDETESILVTIRSGGHRPPLFMVHGGAGLVHLWPDWLATIGEDQPVFGIEARGSRNEAPPHDSVEAMAEDYIGVIRAAYPKGPIFLAGICIGGMIAFEMAQRMLRAGEPPLALLLIDPLAQALRPEGAEGDLESLRQTTAGQAFIREVNARVRDLMLMRDSAFLDEAGSDRLARSLIRVQDGINAAAERYVLKPYPRFIDFFCSADHQRMIVANARGWNSCAAGKARLWPIAPDHHSIFSKHSALLAKCMRKAMDTALQRAAGKGPA